MAQLVCEGLCNGDKVIRFDDAARVNRRIGHGLDGEERVMLREDVAKLGRELKHTEHDFSRTDGSKLIYVCRECETERVWGANR